MSLLSGIDLNYKWSEAELRDENVSLYQDLFSIAYGKEPFPLQCVEFTNLQLGEQLQCLNLLTKIATEVAAQSRVLQDQCKEQFDAKIKEHAERHGLSRGETLAFFYHATCPEEKIDCHTKADQVLFETMLYSEGLGYRHFAEYWNLYTEYLEGKDIE